MKTPKLLIVLVLIFVSACDKKKKGREWISHGDPAELVAGTNLNQGIAEFPTGFDLDNLHLIDQSTAVSKSIKQTVEEVYAEQAPEDDRTSKIFVAAAKKKNIDEKRIQLTVSGGDEYVYKINLAYDKTQIQMESVEKDGVALKIEPKYSHISLDAVTNQITFLFYWNDGEFINLTRIYMGPRVSVNFPRITEKFYYLMGKGVLVKWQKQTTFNICGNPPDEVQNAMTKGFRAWTPHLPSNMFTIQSSSSCLPFSDLNFRGAYFVRNFRTTGGQDFFEPALVLPAVSSEIHDSDMFIFEKEFLVMFGGDPAFTSLSGLFDYIKDRSEIRANNGQDLYSVARSYLSHAMTHEFGHMLGLDHNFDGELSTMSYDNPTESDQLSTYDTQAIKALYK